MDITGFAKGLTQIGQYALARKQQEFKTKNLFALEQLKNEMWKRKLREDAQQKEAYRQYLTNKYTAELKSKEALKELGLQGEREKRAAENDPTTLAYQLKQKEIDLIDARIKDLQNKAAGKGYYSKDKEEKDKSIAEILRILPAVKPNMLKIGDEEQMVGSMKLHDAAINKLKTHARDEYGIILGVDAAGMQKYQYYLSQGYSPPMAEAQVKMDIFNEKNPPKNVAKQPAPKAQKSLQEMTTEELLKELAQ